jgi:hypothetical protein
MYTHIFGFYSVYVIALTYNFTDVRTFARLASLNAKKMIRYSRANRRVNSGQKSSRLETFSVSSVGECSRTLSIHNQIQCSKWKFRSAGVLIKRDTRIYRQKNGKYKWMYTYIYINE